MGVPAHCFKTYFLYFGPLEKQKFMKPEELYPYFLAHPMVTTDSRKIPAGSLFFALKGENFDGNRFAVAALEAGAAFAVVDDPAVVTGERYLLTPDVLESLQQLAAFHRQRLGIPILAITGTNGKTTTKELVSAVLTRKFRVEYTRGNLNNHIGVPLTLLSMTRETQMGVVEMGANHPGEIAFLCRIARPDYGVITNVGKAHLEGFGSFEGVVRTKSELYRDLEERGGTIFINGGNPWLTASAGKNLDKVFYGTADALPSDLHDSSGGSGEKGDNTNGGDPWKSDSQVTGRSVGRGPFLEVEAWWQNEVVRVPTHLIGEYNLENVLAAMAVGRHFGVPAASITAAIAEYVPSNNRSQYIKKASNEVIMDAYNANPSSMKASILNFIAMEHPRKMVILGDMFELGNSSQMEHQRIVDELVLHFRGEVYLAGKYFSASRRPEDFRTFTSGEELMASLMEHPPVGTLILIKGSRGMQLEKIVTLL